MKRSFIKDTVVFFLFSVFTFLLASQSFADSPVTSSDISAAYKDLDIVKNARASSYISENVAEYLTDPKKPIDVKAAVINAIYTKEWFTAGNGNPDRYSLMIYGKNEKDLDLDKLSGDELFCLGYLTLLDRYFYPEEAIPILEKAKEKKQDSFTISIILALAESQPSNDFNHTILSTSEFEKVLDDKNLIRDMRPEAVDIISDYMIGKSYLSPDLRNRLEGTVALSIGKNGAYVNSQLSSIDYANPNVCPFIKDGRTLVPVRFITESLGGTVNWDEKTSTVVVSLNNNKVKIAIGDSEIDVNGSKRMIDVPAEIVNDRTFIPLRALVEGLGKNIFWDDSGLIIISDKENIINCVSDKVILDELIRKFSY